MSVLDFRSDTVTKPSAAMRVAMSDCEVGDDVFGDDPTVLRLEARVAAMFGHEAALFFPTGTMANLAAVMSWCTHRGSEMILGDNCHIYLFEQGGSAFLGGIASRAVPNEEDGTMRLESILAAVRSENVHFPVTQLVCLEQTHNMCGGRILPDGYIASVARELKARGGGGRDSDSDSDEGCIRLHLDGARLWNAASSLGQSVAQVAEGADSVQVCLSKGLGAPAGSVLVGPAAFIARAHRTRKALGGGMRQVGVLAAAGLVALDDFEAGMLLADHARIRRLAEHVALMRGFRLQLEAVQTNICIVHLDMAMRLQDSAGGGQVGSGSGSGGDFNADYVVTQLAARGLKVLALNSSSLRIVTHRDITDACIEALVQGFQAVADSLV